MGQILNGKAFPASYWWPLDCKKGCMYRAADGGCSYILMAGKMRGCEPGQHCIRYKTRKGARKKEDITLGKPDKRKGEASQWDVKKGYELWCQGVSMYQIAKDLGISKSAVQRRKQHHWVFGRA